MSFYNGVITSKLDESKKFYTEKLGFSVKFENEWFVLLERGNREMAFMLPKLKLQSEIFREEFGGKGLWLTIEVEDVAAEFEKINVSGIEIAVELRTEEWAKRIFPFSIRTASALILFITKLPNKLFLKLKLIGDKENGKIC